MIHKSVLFSMLAFMICRLASADNFQIDQENVVPPSIPTTLTTITASVDSAQTFTAGLRGVLSRIEVGVMDDPSNEVPLTIDIARVVGGIPDFSPSGVLAHREVPASAIDYTNVHVPAFTVGVDVLESNIYVAPGDQLAIILRANITTTFGNTWWVNQSGTLPPYLGGGLVRREIPTGMVFDNSDRFDAHFRTYVQVIPEASTDLLLIVGLCALVLIVRPRACLFRKRYCQLL